MDLVNKKREEGSAYYMWLPCAFYSICAGIAALLASIDTHVGAGILLLAAAVILAGWFYRLERSLVSFPVLLSLSWLGGEGIGAMQLSRLQADWTVMSWFCFGGFYVLFLIGYYIGKSSRMIRTGRSVQKQTSPEQFQRRLLCCIAAVSIGSFLTFAAEAVLLGYIPLFSKETHAYDHFHVTGIHYFTVSCMFTHSLTLIYLLQEKKRPARRRLIFLVCCNLLSFSIPVLSVSKFQFVLTLALPILIYLLLRPNVNQKKLFCCIGAAAAAVTGAAVFMTAQRHYEPGYLNGIFQMKNENMPLFLQYVYMYIANNYSNFNCLTQAVADGSIAYAMGLKQLFPVFALTGLKFICPSLVTFYMPTTIKELNTLTLIYDAYYDFGLPGVLLFGLLLGAVCAAVTKKSREAANPIFALFYAQLAIYIGLSFFSAWFTVPTTWFWFAITGLMYLYTGGFFEGKAKKKQESCLQSVDSML